MHMVSVHMLKLSRHSLCRTSESTESCIDEEVYVSTEIEVLAMALHDTQNSTINLDI